MIRLLILVLPAIAAGALSAQARPARPHIVVFVGDDLGWRDSRPYGNAAVRTPNIERLAGPDFSSVTPSAPRPAQPLVDQHPLRTVLARDPHRGLHTPLPPGERLLPSYLQAESYFTGHMAKAHGTRATCSGGWWSDSAGVDYQS